MTVHSTAPAVAKRTLARTQTLALTLIAVATAFHEAAAALLILTPVPQTPATMTVSNMPCPLLLRPSAPQPSAQSWLPVPPLAA